MKDRIWRESGMGRATTFRGKNDRTRYWTPSLLEACRWLGWIPR